MAAFRRPVVILANFSLSGSAQTARGDDMIAAVTNTRVSRRTGARVSIRIVADLTLAVTDVTEYKGTTDAW
jgi:hypothetical protein